MPTAKAGAQCRVPVPSPPPCHGGRRGRQGQARPMGASEAGGGRRDRWGQARLVGAGEANEGRKPPGQIPSQHESDNEHHGCTSNTAPYGCAVVWLVDCNYSPYESAE
jgi:hypothetical protein